MSDKKISQLTATTTPLAGSEVLPVVQSSETKKVSVANLTAGRVVNCQGLYADKAVAGNFGAILFVGNSAGSAADQSGIYGTYNGDYRGGIAFGPGISGQVAIHTGNNATPSDGKALVISGSGARDVKVETGNLVIGTSGKGIDFSAAGNATGMTSELLADYEEGTWTPVVSGLTTAGTYELQNAYGKYVKIGDLLMIEAYIQLASVITGGGAGSLRITGLPFGKPANAYPTGAAYVANITITETPIVVFSSFGASTTLLLQQNASGGFGTSVGIGDVSAGDYISFSMNYRVS